VTERRYAFAEGCERLVARFRASANAPPGRRRACAPRTGVRAPASHNANLEPLVEGLAITLAARHTKVRREGYIK